MTYPPDVHFSRDLRLWIERDASGTRCGFEVVPQMLGPTGFVRTALLASLVDTAGGEGAIRAARPSWVATSDLVLHGIRPVSCGIVLARLEVLRRTRTTVVLEVELEAGDEPVGLATLTFAVLEARTQVQRMGTGADEPRTDFALPGSGLAVPIDEAMRVRNIDRAAGIVELPLGPYVGNSLGALQGGAAALLLELGGEAAGSAALGRRAAARDLAVNYLRLLRKGPARTRARVLRVGTNEALVRVELRDAGDADRLCSVATVLLEAAVQDPVVS